MAKVTFTLGEKEAHISVVGKKEWTKGDFSRVYLQIEGRVLSVYEVVSGGTKDRTVEVEGKTYGIGIIAGGSKTKTKAIYDAIIALLGLLRKEEMAEEAAAKAAEEKEEVAATCAQEPQKEVAFTTVFLASDAPSEGEIAYRGDTKVKIKKVGHLVTIDESMPSMYGGHLLGYEGRKGRVCQCTKA